MALKPNTRQSGAEAPFQAYVIRTLACGLPPTGRSSSRRLPMAGIGAFVYRNRAGGARDIASVTIDGVSRRLLLEIARDYEEIAETLDRIAATESVIRQRQTAPTANDAS